MHGIFFSSVLYKLKGFTSGLGVKNPPANVGDIIWDVGLILIQKDHLEKEMAIHSSILAWEIPCMEQPGRLQSMGSQKSQTQLSDKTVTREMNKNKVTL